MGFRENLKDELKYQDIRVKELADRTGISKRAIDHYLAEKYTEPTAETAVKIAKELGVSVEYLVTGKNSEIPDTIKPEIINLIRDMNHLPDKDIEFIKEMVRRFILSVDKS
ncbi:MAG: helix-turn-helix domain-containing protein [Treponema sp.]|nr:helix-turn-helix domain-containing protein [Treponema sp.]